MARDYAREERRRNELARERGFRSRAEQRHKSETERAAEEAGFDSPEEYVYARREASRWSQKHSHIAATKYHPNGREKNPETFGEYYRVFVDPERDLWSDRDGFRDWMTEETGQFTDDEFDQKYGKF